MKSKSVVFVSAVLIILVAGCSSKDETHIAPVIADDTTKNAVSLNGNSNLKNLAQQEMSTADHVQTFAKPGAAVKLGSAPLIQIVANKPSHTEITLVTEAHSGTMKINLVPSDGLQLLNGAYSLNATLNETGNYTFAVDVIAPVNGRYYLNLQVALESEGIVTSRNVALIVQVGASQETVETSNKAMTREGQSESSTGNERLEKPEAEKIISLPAQEKIRSK